MPNHFSLFRLNPFLDERVNTSSEAQARNNSRVQGRNETITDIDVRRGRYNTDAIIKANTDGGRNVTL
jgi:hypothetical protein